MAEKRPSLNVLSGPLSGRKLVLEDAVDNILIGSDPSCGFVLDTPGVSPIHARLWVDLNGATVYDTNSPNGVYVNDDRVVKEAAVRNGDILWLGPPGEEGSVLIQCILPPPPPAPAEGSPQPEAATPPPLPSREATAPIDSGATMAFGMPAYLGDEPEAAETPPAADTEASDVDSTVVMTSSDIMEPAAPAVVEHAPADASALLDVSEGLELDEPPAVFPPPIPAPPAPPPPAELPEEHGAFPDFEVEPTVAMAPPPLPPRAPASPTPAEPEFSEFEEDMQPTVVDVPAPTIAHAGAPPVPAKPGPPPAGKAAAPAINEDDAVDAATVMYRRLASPPAPPVPAPPAAAPAPPRAAAPPAATP
ncbi:MAG TPA: FHA domain-containing protein, partial [Vicinamibacteria bacterium]|nr:FHA domain-containing protein [Vicinamibacteria bacterium]